MNVKCRTHIHPHDPCDMIRQPNEVVDGKRIAVWRCPYPGCGNIRKQGLRGRGKEPSNGTSFGRVHEVNPSIPTEDLSHV
jgi:hypothetical protein